MATTMAMAIWKSRLLAASRWSPPPRLILLGFLCALCGGCWSADERSVVVYVALDREFSEPILQDFERDTGIKVLAKYDVESTKTVGLATALLQERQRPRCDLFWNNEILHTLRLQREGLLKGLPLPAGESWPTSFRDPGGEWVGLAARARVLLVNRELVPATERPDSIEDLADPRWRGRIGVAKPLFGTTATHVAVLYATWGPERATAFLRQVAANAQVLSGNKQVAVAVGRGQLAWGWTDTDDAIAELDQGHPVEIIYPDSAGAGTLLIPNSLAILRGCPHPEAARALRDYLLRPEVERRLAAGRSAQFPLNPAVSERSRAAATDTPRWQAADFSRAAELWETAATQVRDIFATAP